MTSKDRPQDKPERLSESIGRVREAMTNKELVKAGQDPVQREEFNAEIVTESNWEIEQLQKLDDFQAAIDLVNQTYGSPVDAQVEIGDGFFILTKDQKERLVGMPMLLMQWKFADSQYEGSDVYVTIRCAVQHRDGTMGKYIFSDGGHGIAKQLWDFSQRTNRFGGIILKKGLLRSDYTNQYGPSTTMYLDVSPDGEVPF